MRVLHVGWGYIPFRSGGLIEYAEDLMELQAQNGYHVYYFCTGRSNVFLPNAMLVKRKHKNKGYTIFELVNPPIISGLDKGIDEPLFDIAEPITQKKLFDVINAVKPDIIHFQEFIGIPTSVVAKIKGLGIKTIFTVHDYFTLCPTLKLLLPNGNVCKLKGDDLGKQCSVCCTDAPVNGLFYQLKVTFRDLFSEKNRKRFMEVIKPKLASERQEKKIQTDNLIYIAKQAESYPKAEDYQNRRNSNMSFLKDLDLILTVSNKVASILNSYEKFDNVSALHITVNHIAMMQPLQQETSEIINFGLINVMGSLPKGRQLMLEIFDNLKNCAYSSKIKFTVLGTLSDDDIAVLSEYPFIQYAGKYNPADLNQLLDKLKINVGIVPSLWEEAYGLVGIEFLAKGIPVIGNNIGGIPDYVIDNETGWLNNSCTATELLSIIESITSQPIQIGNLNDNLINNRSKYIQSLTDHFKKLDSIYKQLTTGEVVNSIN
ncbi:glycosyltransferase [Mucilaginibacter lacusdianchii]|uniref:glycosyltransferase n=1 Tax=Mucilaginibacter lacusdianchii TaxID=2684211 RepID=UPI00131ECE08|nr:glycosyltransferase [Mucilaginibacter sp. JXJ CY 39]